MCLGVMLGYRVCVCLGVMLGYRVCVCVMLGYRGVFGCDVRV